MTLSKWKHDHLRDLGRGIVDHEKSFRSMENYLWCSSKDFHDLQQPFDRRILSSVPLFKFEVAPRFLWESNKPPTHDPFLWKFDKPPKARMCPSPPISHSFLNAFSFIPESICPKHLQITEVEGLPTAL